MGLKHFMAGALAAAVIVPSSFAMAQSGSFDAAKPADVAPSDAATTDAKPSDAKPSDAKPSDTRPDRLEELRLACKGVHEGDRHGIVCEWSQAKHPHFDAYRLWRTDGDRREVVFRTDDVTHTRHFDTSAGHGVVYVYKVEVLNRAGETIGGSNAVRAGLRDHDVEQLRLGCEAVAAPAADRSGIACKWSESQHRHFAGYILWRSDGTHRSKVFTSRERGATKALDTEVEAGGTYIYRLHVVDAEGNVIGQSNVVKVEVPDRDRLEELRLACEGVVEGDRHGIACKWTASEHRAFAGYRVWRTDGDKRTIVLHTRDRSRTHNFDAEVRPGLTYIYKVEVLNADGKVIGASNPARAQVPAGTVQQSR